MSLPAALAAGAQLERASSGSVTTAAVAAAAREADMPTGEKREGLSLLRRTRWGYHEGVWAEVQVAESSVREVAPLS